MRRFFTVASIFLALTLSSFAADAGLVQLLPANPRVVAGMNVGQSISSPFGRYLLDQMKNDEADFRKFVDMTGFDPRRDLREVIVANYPGANGETRKERTLIVARGNFDPARLRQLALADGARVLQHLGVDLLAGKNGSEYVGFLDGSTAVAGDELSVRDAVARAKNTSTAGLAADSRRRIDEMSTKYDAWMFTTTPIASIVGNIPDPKANSAVRGDMLRSILSASGGIKLGNTIQIDAQAEARSEKDATALHDVLKFISGMVQLSREENNRNEVAASLFDNLQVSAKGSQVSFSLSIPEEQLEKMVKTSRTPRAKSPEKI